MSEHLPRVFLKAIAQVKHLVRMRKPIPVVAVQSLYRAHILQVVLEYSTS